MHCYRVSIVAIALLCGLPCFAQTANQVELKIDSSNRTLSVSAEERVTAEPEIAILHIGFVTPPSNAKQAYAAGSKASNQIIGALREAGIAENAIRSESQQLESWDMKSHSFRLSQSWAVRVPAARAAEILDVAVTAGATDSGRIEWTVEDELALENKALEQASARARSNALVLAKGMGVQVGSLVYATNQLSQQIEGRFTYAEANFNGAPAEDKRASAPPLAIEPHKVSRVATVYAVYSIE